MAATDLESLASTSPFLMLAGTGTVSCHTPMRATCLQMKCQGAAPLPSDIQLLLAGYVSTSPTNSLHHLLSMMTSTIQMHCEQGGEYIAARACKSQPSTWDISHEDG